MSTTPQISISNVVNVSVSTPPAGLADFQTNNLAIFTKEAPTNGAITATNPGVYRSPSDVVADWGSGSEVAAMANAIFGAAQTILDGGGELVIFPMQSMDTLATVVPAGQKVVYFHGCLYAGYAPADAELEAAAAVMEAIRVLFFVSQYLTSALTVTTGVFDILHTSNLPHTRKWLYTQTGTAAGARLAAAAKAARLMCVDFSGSNTTNNIHLKQLVGIAGDGGITQTVLDRCQAIGVDCYPSIGGRPSVFASGADDFDDNVYNLDWFVLASQVAGFNVLAETGTKIPQTEQGIAVLRGAYIKVMQRAVQNGFLAPGEWNSPEFFGDPDALRRNIRQLGYYIYSQPVALQPQADRAARKAPLIQEAIKYAGAVDSSAVIISFNV